MKVKNKICPNKESCSVTISNDNNDYFEIRHHKHNEKNELWICNKDGEGLVIKESDLYDVIKRYFDENL